MKLQITHETRYEYDPAVQTAQHMAYLRPLTTAQQRVVSHALRIDPVPTRTSETRDVFGNSRCYFALGSAHRQLKVVAHSIVQTESPAAAVSSIAWEQAQALFGSRSPTRDDAAAEFVFASPFCPLHHEFAAYAGPSLDGRSSAGSRSEFDEPDLRRVCV